MINENKKYQEWKSLNQQIDWFKPPDINSILMECIDQLWDLYDQDGTGYLDREEAQLFFHDCMGGKNGYDNELRDSDFEACFTRLDSDGNGVLNKEEMVVFIKELL